MDEEPINAKTDLFQRIRASSVDEAPTKKSSHNDQKVSSWSYDMKGHADHRLKKEQILCVICFCLYFARIGRSIRHVVDSEHLKLEQSPGGTARATKDWQH